MTHSVLLADDDDSIRLVLGKALSRAGYDVKATDNVSTLLKWVKNGEGDILVSDVLMDDEEIFDTLPEIKMIRPDLPVIVISAHANVKTAVQTGQHSVFDYIPKPFDLEDITTAVGRAAKSRKPVRNARTKSVDLPMIGQSKAMQPVFRTISRLASERLNVIVEGEVGTGKNLVARLLHDSGNYEPRKFMTVFDMSDPAAIIEKAGNGDICIDDVSEYTAEMQVGLSHLLHLISVLDETQRPRLIATSRVPLSRLVSSGDFRPDIFYRINQAIIALPTLEDRREDIPDLVKYFIAERSDGVQRQVADSAVELMKGYQWPGNVRELQNFVYKLLALYSDKLISRDMVRQELEESFMAAHDTETSEDVHALMETSCRTLIYDTRNSGSNDAYEQALKWVEGPLLESALQATDGNRAKAAEILGIHRNTLRTKLTALGLDD